MFVLLGYMFTVNRFFYLVIRGMHTLHTIVLTMTNNFRLKTKYNKKAREKKPFRLNSEVKFLSEFSRCAHLQFTFIAFDFACIAVNIPTLLGSYA